MTSVCQWCRTVAPAGAVFCPKCGRQVATGTFPGVPPPPPPPGPGSPGPQWQQQSQWQQQPVWAQTQRRGPGCAAWLIGCSVLLTLGVVMLVIIAIVAGSSSPSTHPRSTTTHRVSMHAVDVVSGKRG
jgi:hypothetical protein